MAETRFRSIQAFRDFEQKHRPSRGGRALEATGEPPAAVLSPIKLLASVKRSPAGASRTQLVRELEADAEAVDAAILRLLKEELVVLRRGDGDEERVVAV